MGISSFAMSQADWQSVVSAVPLQQSHKPIASADGPPKIAKRKMSAAHSEARNRITRACLNPADSPSFARSVFADVAAATSKRHLTTGTRAERKVWGRFGGLP